MEEIQNKLRELLHRLNNAEIWDKMNLLDTRDKLGLYIRKYFNSSQEYIEMLKFVNTLPKDDYQYKEAITNLKRIINLLIEDSKITDKNSSIKAVEESNLILKKARQEAEVERERIHFEAIEIQKMREELQIDRERLLAEEVKFNTFKTKLEVSDKELDFQQHAMINKTTAYIWAFAGVVLTVVLIYTLCDSLELTDTFINIAAEVKNGLKAPSLSNNDDIISKTIYFSFSKYIFTKILLYSILIYYIVFCVKNYNAQMHNNIINTHKSNAFKSTLSLLNTARSDEGNDKLLIQATQAIFSHQQTGYSGTDAEVTSPNVLTNVIDSTAKKI